MEMEKEEADEDEDDDDDGEEEETNDKIVEIKKPKRKPYEDESDLDSSRYYFSWSSFIYTLFLCKAPFTRVRTNFCTDKFCSWRVCLHGSVQILLQWCLRGSVQSLDQLRHLIPGHSRAI